MVYASHSANAYLSYSRAFIHPAAWHHTPRRERLVPSDVPGNFEGLAHGYGSPHRLAAVVRHGAHGTRQRIEVSTIAYAKITRQWPDDSACVIEVGCQESYPDAVAQCVAEVARLEGLVMPDEAEAPESEQ